MKKETILCGLLLLAGLIPLSAQENTLQVGGDAGWDLLEKRQGISTVLDPLGRPLLVLATGEYAFDRLTDLLYHFNDASAQDLSGHYKQSIPWSSISQKLSKMGQGSAIFQNTGDGLRLEAQQGSLFYPGTPWEDFTLEFWLYPATVQEGETIFLWQGSRSLQRQFYNQEFRIVFTGRKIQINMDNFFVPPSQGSHKALLSGRSTLLPRVWKHHMIRFDSRTGLLEYLVDGVPEDSTHTTATGREDPQVYLPFIGSSSQRILQIGPQYTGGMDEFRLTRQWNEQPQLFPYASDAGVVESRIIDLGREGSVLNSIRLKTQTSPKTSLALFYRIAEDKSYQWQRSGPTLTYLDEAWIPISSGMNLLGGPRGRYAQFRVEFLPDGLGQETPKLLGLELTYLKNLPPSAPAVLTAEPSDASVRLSWSPVLQKVVTGYRIYYGEQPGKYTQFIDVGLVTEHTVPGLTNLKLYYFTVSAYEEITAGQKNFSPFAKEVLSRPQKDGL